MLDMASPLSSPPLLSPNAALFLDFDGTLAGFQDDPDAVHLTVDQTDLLLDLSAFLGGALAVVTGRDITDISKRVPSRLWRAGNHGAAIARPDEPGTSPGPAPESLVAAMVGAAALAEGLWVESKGPVLALHTRQAPEQADAAAATLVEALAAETPLAEEYRLVRGQGVVEFKPRAANKGRAIRELMGQSPFTGRTPYFLGDDRTDEDGFTALNEGDDAVTIKVGQCETLARFRLDLVTSVWEWLGEGAQALRMAGASR